MIKLEKKEIFIALVIFIAFFTFYFMISAQLEGAGAFLEFDTLFEIDPPRAIEDMTQFDGNHARTIVHPLYVLMVNPLGILIKFITHSGMLSARIMNSAFGALGVMLGFLLFLRFELNIIDSLLLTSLFGVSTSQFFLSSIPDTASLAVCSLILTYFLFFHSYKVQKIHFLGWCLAGLFSLAVTTTNFAQTVICFFMATLSIDQHEIKGAIGKTAKMIVVVMLAAVVLSLIQKIIYPSSILFFDINAYGNEFTYASTIVFQHPRLVITHLVKNFLMSNIIAPAPIFFDVHGRENPMLTFGRSYQYSTIGWIALFIWVSLLAFNWIKIVYQKENKPFYIGLVFCLAFNFLLHSFYGVTENHIELFLYTGNLTFLTIIPLAYSLSTGKSIFTRFLLIILIIFTFINNLQVINLIIKTYGS